ncbi:MAG: MoxR family ATPase [Dehalococcoidia bacterium]|nr:MoxR family ATPase [Dehalococcoidia bacterium]
MDPKAVCRAILDNVGKVIVGKDKEVELALLALISNGHLLIEDVPGVGKTMLAKSIVKSIGCTFRRIQFTPDLLPSDVTGVSVYNQRTGEFEFRPGPILAQVVLADEINRATPKTQSALLECMEEHQVTVDGTTYPSPKPFLVMATQNPIEYEGTFPLPEAQVDRFFMRLTLGYPSAQDEMEILERQLRRHPVDTLGQVVDSSEILAAQEAIREVRVDPLIIRYIVFLVEATRSHPEVYLGSSPRGSLGLVRASQGLALLRGRDFVLPDDVKELAEPVLAHRIIISPAACLREVTSKEVLADVLGQVPVPGVRIRQR